MTRPRARTGDPDTSHAAAASISEGALRLSQAALLTIIRGLTAKDGGATDPEIARVYTRYQRGHEEWPKQSESGLRTRRKELVTAGLVEDTGNRVRLPSSRTAIVWRSTTTGPQGTLL